jgi:hypothetical protein
VVIELSNDVLLLIFNLLVSEQYYFMSLHAIEESKIGDQSNNFFSKENVKIVDICNVFGFL